MSFANSIRPSGGSDISPESIWSAADLKVRPDRSCERAEDIEVVRAQIAVITDHLLERVGLKAPGLFSGGAAMIGAYGKLVALGDFGSREGMEHLQHDGVALIQAADLAFDRLAQQNPAYAAISASVQAKGR